MSRPRPNQPHNSAAAADGNRVALCVGATLSRAVAAAERQTLAGVIMQPGNEYTLTHLRALGALATEIDTWPAEVVSLEYLYEHFGHWSLIVRRKGQRTRFAFDARDSVLSAERLSRNAGDFATPPKQLGDLALPSGLTESSLPAVVAFVRAHAG